VTREVIVHARVGSTRTSDQSIVHFQQSNIGPEEATEHIVALCRKDLMRSLDAADMLFGCRISKIVTAIEPYSADREVVLSSMRVVRPGEVRA
jgi:hypothetical protein